MTDLEIIRAAYDDDSIENPRAFLIARLPHLTPAAISTLACTKGFSRARRERRIAAGLDVGRSCGGRKRRAKATGKPRACYPEAKPTTAPVLRSGPCDRGEREAIRRRLLFQINALAVELSRNPAAVAETMRAIARDNFAEVAPLEISRIRNDALRQAAVREKYALTPV